MNINNIINLVLSISIIIINTFVFILFLMRPQLTKKPSNRLLHSLSVCDWMSGTTVIIHVMIERSIFPHQSFAIRIGAEIYTTFIVGASVLHLLCITIDRALSLFYALRYKDIVTLKSIKRVVIGIWVIPGLTSSLQITYLHPYVGGSDNISLDEVEKIRTIEMWYSIICFVAYLMIPFIVMGILFFMMFREVRKIILRTPSYTGQFSLNVTRQQRRAVYIFAVMYFCFATLTLPHFTFRIYLDIQSHISQDQITINLTILNLFYIMKTLTSLCNPVMYTVLNREFRSVIQVWIREKKKSFNRKFLSPQSSSSMGFMTRESLIYKKDGILVRIKDSDGSSNETEV
ncbi:melanocyte-stimulating hormone receptor-like [Clytia hemisphaerica]|uniref:melanocyte-stimulating hormone receptor-like n=1 Tax=Clytia hemisphaerica TaxID=252671 RepID=UPI0034D6CAAF